MGHSRWRNFLFFQAIAAHICVLHSAVSVSITFKDNQCYGGVQIENGGETFCDDRWDFNNSKVLCSQSRCGTALKPLEEPTPKSPDFLCQGNESSFDVCERKENKTQSCKRKAFVVCSVALSQPKISLRLPNGTWINSSLVEIPRGSSFVINCSVDSTSYESKSYFLLRHDKPSNKSELENYHPASFIFPMVDYNDTGNYSCVYEVKLNGTYTSDETEWIHIIVTDPWWNLLLYILPAGILVLLLMVLLVVCLVCRRRAEKLSDVVLNQVTVRNSYADDEDEEERDYVNVELMDTKNLRAEEVDKEDSDSHDYEEPKEDEEDEEDEEDSSDDADDYVNLAEQTVEIYGEELDIYQNL